MLIVVETESSGTAILMVDEIIDQRFEEGDETSATLLYTRPDNARTLADGVKICEDKQRLPDVVRVITPYQGVCGAPPKITVPQSSPIASSFGSQSMDPEKTRLFGRVGSLPLGRKYSVSTPVGTSATFAMPYSLRITCPSSVETAITWSKRRQASRS